MNLFPLSLSSLNNINKKRVLDLLQHMTFRHYTLSYLMINLNLNFYPLLIFLLKGTKVLLDYLTMLQHTGERKQKGGLVLVKHHLKQL